MHQHPFGNYRPLGAQPGRPVDGGPPKAGHRPLPEEFGRTRGGDDLGDRMFLLKKNHRDFERCTFQVIQQSKRKYIQKNIYALDMCSFGSSN